MATLFCSCLSYTSSFASLIPNLRLYFLDFPRFLCPSYSPHSPEYHSSFIHYFHIPHTISEHLPLLFHQVIYSHHIFYGYHYALPNRFIGRYTHFSVYSSLPLLLSISRGHATPKDVENRGTQGRKRVGAMKALARNRCLSTEAARGFHDGTLKIQHLGPSYLL